ncbi:MAG: insulinase family protein [Acidobacteriota bacterium]
MPCDLSDGFERAEKRQSVGAVTIDQCREGIVRENAWSSLSTLNFGKSLSSQSFHLGRWHDGVGNDFRKQLEATLEVRIIDRPDSPQTELRLGHVGPTRTDPDYVPLQVMNSLLGGKFTSRINLKLREELGITYGASSGFANRRGHGPFVVSTSVDSDSVGVATEEILQELHRMQQDPVSIEELEDTKNYLLGVFPYTLQRIEGIANRIAEIALYDLPLDYYARSLAIIRGVDPDQVQNLARKHLHPNRIGIVAVGPAAVLAPQLEPFGSLQITAQN